MGLAVVGFVHPDRLLTKGGVRPGDTLALTKPLGTGCITTAAKNDRARAADVADAIGWMARLNRDAAEAAAQAGARGVTDITGFGFLGHAAEMANASGVTLRVTFDRVPFLPGAQRYAGQWIFPGGSTANAEAFSGDVIFDAAVTEVERMLLFDAQTSGGLLIALPPGALETFEREMRTRGALWWVVGEAAPREQNAAVIVTR